MTSFTKNSQFQFEIISESENHQLQFFQNNQNLGELPVSSISTTFEQRWFPWKNLQWAGGFMAGYLIWETWLYAKIKVFDSMRNVIMNLTNHPDNHRGLLLFLIPVQHWFPPDSATVWIAVVSLGVSNKSAIVWTTGVSQGVSIKIIINPRSWVVAYSPPLSLRRFMLQSFGSWAAVLWGDHVCRDRPSKDQYTTYMCCKWQFVNFFWKHVWLTC